MPNAPTPELAETTIKPMLEWLALARGRSGLEEATGLQRQLLTLREIPLPPAQRLKLLDLIYGNAARLTLGQLPTLHAVTLPVSRRIRQMVRATQDMLEALSQDYLATLAELFQPAADETWSPLSALRRTVRCLSWHLTISYLAAAPQGTGTWQQLHSTFRTSRRLGLDTVDGPGDEGRIEQIYVASLLLSVVQPASFTARELEFILQYIDQCLQAIELSPQVPDGREGIFWVDPERDMPPNALTRRSPPPDTPVLYFACDSVAQRASDHLSALESGCPAADLGLPAFADGHAGRGVLKRLSSFWGRPPKRRFPRRRQSYRANLCAGLEDIWQLLRQPDQASAASEWMITNESPDGYAMMHVSGATEQLRVGDIVALRPRRRATAPGEAWEICIVRWALSENPEHIEIGLQVMAGRAIPAMLALPQDPQQGGCTTALLLPEAPPLRPSRALVLPTGVVRDMSQKLVLVVEQDNLAVYEMQATQLDEQTASIELFNVALDERP